MEWRAAVEAGGRRCGIGLVVGIHRLLLLLLLAPLLVPGGVAGVPRAGHRRHNDIRRWWRGWGREGVRGQAVGRVGGRRRAWRSEGHLPEGSDRYFRTNVEKIKIVRCSSKVNRMKKG